MQGTWETFDLTLPTRHYQNFVQLMDKQNSAYFSSPLVRFLLYDTIHFHGIPPFFPLSLPPSFFLFRYFLVLPPLPLFLYISFSFSLSFSLSLFLSQFLEGNSEKEENLKGLFCMFFLVFK